MAVEEIAAPRQIPRLPSRGTVRDQMWIARAFGLFRFFQRLRCHTKNTKNTKSKTTKKKLGDGDTQAQREVNKYRLVKRTRLGNFLVRRPGRPIRRTLFFKSQTFGLVRQAFGRVEISQSVRLNVVRGRSVRDISCSLPLPTRENVSQKGLTNRSTEFEEPLDGAGSNAYRQRGRERSWLS